MLAQMKHMRFITQYTVHSTQYTAHTVHDTRYTAHTCAHNTFSISGGGNSLYFSLLLLSIPAHSPTRPQHTPHTPNGIPTNPNRFLPPPPPTRSSLLHAPQLAPTAEYSDIRVSSIPPVFSPLRGEYPVSRQYPGRFAASIQYSAVN